MKERALLSRARFFMSSAMSLLGTKLPIRDVRSSVAIEGEADIVRKVQFGSD